MTAPVIPKRGRPPLSPGEVTERVTIRLPAAQVERLREIGDGSISDGVRELLRRASRSGRRA